jgi:hypothetical protein
MTGLLDPAATAAFDARHGQVTTTLAGGGLVLSCDKRIRHPWRSALLCLPGLFRLDVCPFADTLQVKIRPLHPQPERWNARITDEAPWAAARADSEVPWRGSWICVLDVEPRAVVVRIDLARTQSLRGDVSHLVGHAVIRETDRV